MTDFIHDDFLLRSEPARRLYHDYAKSLPIYDYHNHLSPKDIAHNRRFNNLHELWLEGDHYKWRAMRWNGIAEDLITGDATPFDKFKAYAATVPKALRNPLYHWTHLELKRYFGITELLSEETAESIWNRANEQLANLGVHDILKESNVAVCCTSDDPGDSLKDHTQIRTSKLKTRVYPTFRQDAVPDTENGGGFTAWLDRLSAASDADCRTFDGLLAGIGKRHRAFHDAGGRLSDHGLAGCPSARVREGKARDEFETIRSGKVAFGGDLETLLINRFALLDAQAGWAMQLHLGPLRDNNIRLRRMIGANAGCDSIGDFRQISQLRNFLGFLDADNRLPKTILYNVNPADNYAFATMAGNFQDGSIPGKIQFGPAWWFLDQADGIKWQLNTLSNIGLLSRFVGMVGDSRSFLSFSRHEYFRRVMCDLIGQDIVDGKLPNDVPMLGKLVADVCFHNAKNYFGLELDPSFNI